MKLLSLRLCDHDSNISYFDGEKLHYFKSERKYGVKHHGYSNLQDWEKEIFSLWGITREQVDDIVIIVDPERHGLEEDTEVIFPSQPFILPGNISVTRINHHLAHALSVDLLEDTASDISFVVDGYGDKDIAWTVIKNNKIIDIGFVSQNGSIGIELAQVAKRFFDVRGHGLDMAGKLMGLQSYGNLDLTFLLHLNNCNVYNVKELYDINKWIYFKTDETLAQHSLLDWVNTVHYKTGNILLELFNKYASPSDTISYSGGVALNIVWNSLLKENFPLLRISPYSGDEGLSIGGIEWLRRKHNLPRIKLDNFPYCQTDEGTEIITDENIDYIVECLCQGKVVACYQENGEIGPRALGNRSIFVDPRLKDAKKLINNIKQRENYRPFGSSILEEYKNNYFLSKWNDPYMLYQTEVIVDDIQAVTHIDRTCRVQTVADNNTFIRRLLVKFNNRTGCPLLLNTSLNVNGKGIAGHIQEAEELFFNSNLDVLVVGNKVYSKSNL